jgi:YidC/Oxa1 family membrane protein insertase
MNIFTTILVQPLTNGLILFYKLLWSNMGLAIIAFGLVLRALVNPLTKPYMESMKKIKALEPQLSKLKEKYKNDKQKLVQAQADFYKQNKVNPGAGCLPYLLQIVILIALFSVFSKVLISGPEGASKVNELLYPAVKIAEGQEINNKFLYMDLSKPDTFRIPGIGFALPGPLLLLAAFAQFLSAKIMAPVAPKKEGKKGTEEKSQTEQMTSSMQQSMIYTMPLFTIIFGLKFPAGLALYWFLFSMWQFVQQYFSTGWGGLSPWLSKLGLLKSTAVIKK